MLRTSHLDLIRARPRLAGLLIVLVLTATTVVVSTWLTVDHDIRPRATAGGDVSLTGPIDAANRGLGRCTPGATKLASCGQAPALQGIDRWLGTPGDSPIDLADLRGKVVLIDFFAYSCVGCQRSLPQVRAWAERYRDAGLEVVGVHSPEFTFESDAGNVAAAMAEADLPYPVALDTNLATTTEYRNRFRPAMYLVDAEGTVRSIQLGEGGYGRTETQIRTLLERSDPDAKLPDPTGVRALPATTGSTPRIDLSYGRDQRYRGAPPLRLGRPRTYFASREQRRDSYGLDGRLRVERQYVEAVGDRSQIVLSYRAAKVYAVLGGPRSGRGQASVRVTSPGRAPRRFPVGARPGLIRLVDEPGPRRAQVTLTLSRGVRAYAVSFG